MHAWGLKDRFIIENSYVATLHAQTQANIFSFSYLTNTHVAIAKSDKEMP